MESAMGLREIEEMGMKVNEREKVVMWNGFDGCMVV